MACCVLDGAELSAVFLMPPVSIANAVCCFLKALINQTLSTFLRTDFVSVNKRRLNMVRIV